MKLSQVDQLRAWGRNYSWHCDYRVVVENCQVASASSPEWGRAYLLATGRLGRVERSR